MDVCIGKNKVISNYTEEELLRIKEDLTLDNPKYAQVKKYSKYKNTRVPKYLFYYTQISKAIIVPRGYNIPFEHSILEDTRNENTVNYPPFKLTLRETQKEAKECYLEDTDKGLIVLPTGKGKTILGLNLAYSLRQKTLVIVHKDDLVDGWSKDCKLCFGDDFKVGIYKAKKREIGEQVTIATIQTLNRLDAETLEEFQSNFGLVILDECHHIASSSFDLLHRFNSCYKIGLSATPERADGLTEVMYHHLGECAYKHEIQKDDKDILPVKVITQTLNNVVVDIYAKEKSKGVYEILPLEAPFNFNYINIKEIDYKYRPKVPYFDVDNRVLSYPRFFHHVVNDIYKEYKNGRSIICFFSQKKHVEKYEELLIERGVPKEKILLYYGDAKQSKDEMKQKAESKEVMITLATYSIATEGTNVKAWEVAFLVSSINNGKNTEQAVGRIRRSAEGKITPVKVYDYVLPNVYSIGDKHYKTRRQRYKKLGFEIVDDIKDNKGLFSRGFKK